MNPQQFRFAIFLLAGFSIVGCARISQSSVDRREERPFFQAELETETHGRKTWFDYLVETDPGGLDLRVASDYMDHPPAVVAVLPFCDTGSANFTVNKLPITFRNQHERDQWAWTDAQRLRRAVVGFLAQREFDLINPIAVDAVLQQRKIDNMEKLRRENSVALGRLLGADALMYGQVNSYEGYYFAVLSAYRIDVTVWMVSTRDGETLMRATGSRYSADLQPTLSPQDFAINAVLSLLQFRDVTLARAEEEVSRELVLGIPVASKLKKEMATRALRRAEEAEAAESGVEATPSKMAALRNVAEPALLLSAPDSNPAH